MPSWFKNIKNKKSCKFLKFDIIQFYPSITEKLFHSSINFAKRFINIEDYEINVIFHYCKSILFSDDSTWIKKNNSEFDITMGSYDGAEICKLVGLFLLHELSTIIPKDLAGLYRDDSLAILRNSNGPNTDRIKKRIIKLFQKHNLKITIEANIIQTDFLDITLNVKTEKHWLFRKPNDEQLYININSQSGYKDNLIFSETQPKNKSRKRNIIWFNLPFNNYVANNIGKEFLKLISKHFPPQHKLHKILNRNSIKINYSCMPNKKTIITSHNKKLLEKKSSQQSKPCNCKNKDICPLKGSCQQKSVIYQADISHGNITESYIGCSDTEFKSRYYNHIQSFKNIKKRHRAIQNILECQRIRSQSHN